MLLQILCQEKMYSMETSERLKKIRETAGLNQSQIAKRLGITRGHWSNLEAGRALPNALLIVAIEAVYGVSRAWLETGSGEMYYTNTSTNASRLHELLDQAIKRQNELEKELVEEKKKRIPDIGRYERNKESIEYLRESHPEYEIDPDAEEEFCKNFGGFLGGVSSKGIMGVLDRIKRRKRYHDVLDGVFGYEPELAERLQTLLEQPGGVDMLKELLGIEEKNKK